jgi:hypothetical protein
MKKLLLLAIVSLQSGPIAIPPKDHHMIYPEDYGAFGDNVHDDTVSFRTAFASCKTGCSVHLMAKTYLTTDQIDIGSTTRGSVHGRSLIGEGPGVSVINCQPKDKINSCVRNLNGASVTIKDLEIRANDKAMYALSHELTASSAEQQTVSNVMLNGGQFTWAIGPQTHGDISHVNGFGVFVAGGAIANIVVGDGFQGNVLDNDCWGCTSDLSKGVGLLQRGGGFSWHGGGFDENRDFDIVISTPSDQPMVLDGIRCEGSKGFLKWLGGGNTYDIGQVSISNLRYTSYANPNPDPYVVYFNGPTTISITNSKFNSTPTINMYFGNSINHPTHVYMNNVGITNPNWPSILQDYLNNPSVVLDSTNDWIIDAKGNSVPGSGKTYSSSSRITRDMIEAR